MASLLERIQNVFDNHQDLQRERIRQEGHQQALYQTRDALLGSAVLLKDDWSQELTRTRSESHAGIHARYEARIQGLNDAFSVLRQSEPGITTQLNPDEFRESAARRTQSGLHGVPELQHSPYQYAYAATRQQLDLDFAHRENDRAKQQFIGLTARLASICLPTCFSETLCPDHVQDGRRSGHNPALNYGYGEQPSSARIGRGRFLIFPSLGGRRNEELPAGILRLRRFRICGGACEGSKPDSNLEQLYENARLLRSILPDLVFVRGSAPAFW